jgi:pilus assembly protein Flp/PilA
LAGRLVLNNKFWREIMTKFVKDESGATAIEYGLIASVMALMLATAMPSITTALTGKFASIGTSISTGK